MSSAPDSDTVEQRLTQVVEQLQIPNSTLQITQVRLNRLGTEPDIDEERMDEVAAAALALSCREDGLPISEADIAETWSEILDSANIDVAVAADQLSRQIEAVAEYLDLGEPPAHPGELIRQYGNDLGMPEDLIAVGLRLLQDCFQTDATVVAGGTSPSGTAGATLYLAAEANDLDDEYTQARLGDVSETSEVTVRNRYRELQDLLGEDRLGSDRYSVEAEAEADADTEVYGESDAETETEETADEVTEAEAEPEAATRATDGNGDAAAEEAATGEDVMTAEQGEDREAAGEDGTAGRSSADGGADQGAGAATGSSTSPAGGRPAGETNEDVVTAVESEVDDLTDEVDAGASTRLFARGMIGDAVERVGVEDAPELAGAALVAGGRMEDSDLEPKHVAAVRSYGTRDIYHWLDHLDEAVAVDIPRRSADEIVARLVANLELSEEVREESLRALQQYRPADIDAEYTAAELGAGAVFFAATVGRTQVEMDDLVEVTGAAPEYVTDAMNSVVVSLCLSLVRGDIDYDDCSWTTDLLESELSPDIGDSYTGRVIAIAKTYTAGRERQHIDHATLDVILGSD